MPGREKSLPNRCCALDAEKPEDVIDPAEELMQENNRMLADVHDNLSKMQRGSSPWLKESMASEVNNITEIASQMRKEQQKEFDKFRLVLEEFAEQQRTMLERHEQLVEQMSTLSRSKSKRWTMGSKSFVLDADEKLELQSAKPSQGSGGTTAEADPNKKKQKKDKNKEEDSDGEKISARLSHRPSLKDMAKSVVASMGRKKRRKSREGRSQIGVSSAPWTRDEAEETYMSTSHYHDGEIDDVFPILSQMVNSLCFQLFLSVLIISNAIFVAIQVQYAADNYDNPQSEAPLHLTILDMIYCVLFTFEISCRLLVERGSFFWSNNMYWNIFDLILVGLAVQDQIASYVLIAQGEAEAAVKSEQGEEDSSFSFLRLIRVLRILRVVRLFKFFPQLTVMLNEVLESISAIMWLFVLLGIILFIVGLVFMNATTNFLRTSSLDHKLRVELKDAFGSLPAAFLSLFKAVSGGVEWEKIGDNLMEISVLYGTLFVAYLAFVVFGIVNVVTGVFVTSAQKTAKLEEDDDKKRILDELKIYLDEFSSTGDEMGIVDREMFEYYLNTEDRMKQLLKPLKIVPADASHMFDLLMDSETKVTNSRLTKGFCRLLGGAKSTDLVFLLFETRRLADELFGFFCYVEANFRTISTAVGVKNGERRYLPGSPRKMQREQPT